MDAGVGEARRAEAKQAQLSILDEVVGDQLTLDSRETSRKQQRNKAAAALHRGLSVCGSVCFCVCMCCISAMAN